MIFIVLLLLFYFERCRTRELLLLGVNIADDYGWLLAFFFFYFNSSKIKYFYNLSLVDVR